MRVAMAPGSSMDMPPSTTRDSPETKLARSETRNSTALAMSWASPRRRTGFWRAWRASSSGVGGLGGGFVFDVGHDAAGQDAVGPNAVLAIGHGDVAHERVDGGLGGLVGALVGGGLDGRGRTRCRRWSRRPPAIMWGMASLQAMKWDLINTAWLRSQSASVTSTSLSWGCQRALLTRA